MTASTPKHVAVVIRVSTDAQDTARQEALVPDLAAREFPDVPIVIYKDDGVSALDVSVFDRPATARLCRAIEQGQVLAIVADEQSRLCRGGTLEWATFYDLLRTAHVRLLTLAEGEVRDDDTGELIGLLTAWKDKKESIDKRHRVHSQRLALAREGLWPYAKVPLGYEKGPDGRLRPGPDADLVRQLGQRFVNGESIKAVAHDNGLQHRTLKSLLRRETYRGHVVNRGEVVCRDAHPAIFDAELAAAIDARLRRQAAAFTHRSATTQPYGALVACSTCGGGMRVHIAAAKDGGHTYVGCRTRSCPARRRSRIEFVDAAVVLGLMAAAYALRTRLDDPTWAPAHDDGEAGLLALQLEDLDQRRDALTDLLADGLLPVERARDQLARLAAARDQAAALYEEATGSGLTRRERLAELRDELAVLDACRRGSNPDAGAVGFWIDATVDERRTLLNRLLRRITIGEHSLTLAFHAGIDVPVPLKRYRDPEIGQALVQIGFGRKWASPTRGTVVTKLPPSVRKYLQEARILADEALFSEGVSGCGPAATSSDEKTPEGASGVSSN